MAKIEELKTVLSAVDKMANLFKAFENGRRVMNTLVNAEGTLEEIEKSKVEIGAELVALTEERNKKKAEFDNYVKALPGKIKAAKDKADTEIAEAQKAAEEAVKLYKGKKEGAEKGYKDAISAIEEKIQILKSAKEAMEKELLEAQTKYAAFKASLPSTP
jgi:hypothetical protein